MADLRDDLQSALGTAYSVERELGGGGMARVFVATETALGRPVVVKVLPPETSEALSAERFKREIQLAARLQHPCIVPLLAAGEAALDANDATNGRLLYYTMPLVSGDSLRARLASGELPVPEAVRILRDLAAALAYAHERGIVHRDLKPDNVLLSGGYALVTDFGVAKALSVAATAPGAPGPVTATGILLGTPMYMAPEQAAGDPSVDHRADLYALGVVAYEMLAGERPFAGTTPQALLAAHLTRDPVPLTERRPSVPSPLGALVMRLLAKQPGDRLQSADDVLRELDTIAASRGGTQPAQTAGALPATGRHSWFDAGARHTRHHRVKYAALALAIALLGVGLTYRSISRRSYISSDVGGGAGGAGAVAADVKSIAVLPFANLSADPENEYFSDGMTEELIAALSKVEGLRVLGRTSSFAFKRERPDLRTIGERVHVATVLDGSVRRAGNRLRVTAQLVNVADGYELWSETFERELKDIFAVQDEIARAIVGALRGRLMGGDTASLVPPPTGSLASYELYLRGRYFWNQRTADGLSKAIGYFKQAVAGDPRYARAYAGLASAYVVQPEYGDVNPREAYARAKDAALRALELDSALAEAHTALGQARCYGDWNWAGADSAYRRAIALDPGYATGHQWLGVCLAGQGRLNEAIAAQHRAHELEPLSRIIATSLAKRYRLARRDDLAIAYSQKALELDSGFAQARHHLSLAYLQKGLPREAVAEAQRAVALGGRRSMNLAGLAASYAAARDRAEATRILRELEARSRSGSVLPFALALVYTMLADTAHALTAMEEAAAARDPMLVDHFASDPLLDPLRSAPRFIQLRRRMGLDP